MEKIKINLQELARELMEVESFSISDTVCANDTESHRELIENYLVEHYSKDNQKIEEPEMARLIEELDAFILLEIHNKTTELIESMDKEARGVFAVIEKEYDTYEEED